MGEFGEVRSWELETEEERLRVTSERRWEWRGLLGSACDGGGEVLEKEEVEEMAGWWVLSAESDKFPELVELLLCVFEDSLLAYAE